MRFMSIEKIEFISDANNCPESSVPLLFADSFKHSKFTTDTIYTQYKVDQPTRHGSIEHNRVLNTSTC
jgi:hypothetical protein